MTPHAAQLMLRTRPAEHPQQPVKSGRRRGELLQADACTVTALLLHAVQNPGICLSSGFRSPRAVVQEVVLLFALQPPRPRCEPCL